MADIMKFVIRKVLWMICYIIFWEIARVLMGASDNVAIGLKQAIAMIVGVAVLAVIVFFMRKTRIPAVISSAVRKLQKYISE